MNIDLGKSLQQMEDLVCNKDNANLLIIKSHTLEILLSLTENENFLKEIANRDKLLETFINSMDSPILRHKILLMFVNLSAQKNLANKLVQLGVIKALYQILFDAMKRINVEHLDIKTSLLVDATTKENLTLKKPKENKSNKNRILEEKKYEISQAKIKKEDQSKMLDLDSIKLSIMIFMNCSLFSNQARVEILGIETANLTEGKKEELSEVQEKLRNLQIVIDWVNHERIGHLFKNFVFVLTNLSSDPQLRSLLVEHSMEHFNQLFAFFWKQRKDFDTFLQICQIFRNFSFEYENQKLKDSFHSQKIIPLIAESLEFEEFSSFEKNRIKLILVDLLWIFHTNIDFCKSDTPLINFRYDGDKLQLNEWIKDKDLLSLSLQNPDRLRNHRAYRKFLAALVRLLATLR